MTPHIQIPEKTEVFMNLRTFMQLHSPYETQILLHVKKKLRLHLEMNAQAPKGISQQYKLKRNIFIEILQLS